MSTLPALLRRVGTTALTPLTFLEVFFRRSDAAGDFFPTDAPHGDVPGADPEADARRVIVVGEPGMISLGVLSYEIGLAGFLARELARIDNRGVHWEVREIPSSRIKDAQNVVEAAATELRTADAAVLMLGISDVLAFSSLTEWERHLHALITSLAARLPEDSVIAVAEVPPLDNAGSISKMARFTAGLRSRVQNEVTRSVVSSHPTALTVPFPELLTRTLWVPRSQEHQYRNTYAVWGAAVAGALALRGSDRG